MKWHGGLKKCYDMVGANYGMACFLIIFLFLKHFHKYKALNDKTNSK